MNDTGAPAAAYVAAHVQDALATDDRVGELGLRVDDAGHGRFVVRGSVSTPERKAAVAVVAAEVLAAWGWDGDVVDDTCVPAAAPPDTAEELR